MSDPFWNINGQVPLKKMPVDGTGEVTGSKKKDGTLAVYTLKRFEDHYTCTCPAWAFQKTKQPDERTCKHLKSYLGDKYETARLAHIAANKNGGDEKAATSAAPEASTSTSKKRKTDPETTNFAPAKKAKAVKGGKKQEFKDEDEDEEQDGVGGGSAGDGVFTSVGKELNILLANKFDMESDKVRPAGYLMSEKLDGVRVYWDGKGKLYSRLGNPFYAPKWFTDKLPKNVTLDGELWRSRNSFSETISIVKSHSSQKWGEIIFKVFDSPSAGHLAFEARMEKLKKMFPVAPAAAAGSTKAAGSTNGEERESVCELVEQITCRDKDHLLEYLKEVESNQGEGVMLRKAGSLYEKKRSNTLLKVKTFFDAEAEVIGHEPGKGKYKGMTGSLIVKMASGKTFNVGSGMTDDLRSNPPKVGAIVNYRFQEITKAGVPRFPTFMGEAIDKTEAKDAEIPEHRLAEAGTAGDKE